MTLFPTGQKKMSEYIGIATTLFDLYIKYSVEKEKVEDAIFNVVGVEWKDGVGGYDPDIEDIIFDYYDCSFELHGIDDDNWRIPEEAFPKLRDMGFQRAWVKYVSGQEETYYYFGD
jgi:hypothetical protein